jgi:uncharacterized protein YukE
MFNFLKKLFAKEEIPEESVSLEQLSTWLDEKIKPISDNLNNNINQIITKINEEKDKVKENLKILEDAKLQNPKIPERAKTIMEGNRTGFIKKVSYFFENLDIKNEASIVEKCKNIKNEIESLGKGTARSYQVLNEFFAREAENIAINIKNIENYSNEIVTASTNSKLSNTDKIKDNISNIKKKINIRKDYTSQLENQQQELNQSKDKRSKTENNINGEKSSKEYKEYEKLLEEGEKTNSKLNEIESTLFHDFSALEKALKKYAKIAFENEKLILEYLSNPTITLIKDTEFKISEILGKLKVAIEHDELELDDKKKSKAVSKINDLDEVYLNKLKEDYKNAKERLNNLNAEINNNTSKKSLDTLNEEFKIINQNIESLSHTIDSLNNELGKIDIKQLKENLQEEVSSTTNIKVTVA